jgi:hypothetical protein
MFRRQFSLSGKDFSQGVSKFRENPETLESAIPLYGGRRAALTNEKSEADRTKQNNKKPRKGRIANWPDATSV